MSIFLPNRRSVLLTRKPGVIPANFDVDAAAYIAGVEGPLGDNQTLEIGVRAAINDFVVGCKADGIWSAIKASCILAGARTLSGALVPLVGTAPGNLNFVTSDYNRKIGLKGDGSTKRLNSQYSAQNINTNNSHLAVNGSNFETTGSGKTVIGIYNGGTYNLCDLILANPNRQYRCSLNTDSWPTTSAGLTTSGTVIGSRTSATNAALYQDGDLSSANTATATASNLGTFNLTVFGLTDQTGLLNAYSSARLNFYSIGTGLSGAGVAALHARVTALITAFGTAIP